MVNSDKAEATERLERELGFRFQFTDVPMLGGAILTGTWEKVVGDLVYSVFSEYELKLWQALLTRELALQEKEQTHGKDSIYSPEFNAACFAKYVEIRKFPWTEEDTKELAEFMRHIQKSAFWEGQQSKVSVLQEIRELAHEAQSVGRVMDETNWTLALNIINKFCSLTQTRQE